MSIGEFCNREVVLAERTTSVREAAQHMRQYHVGDLVVVDLVDGKRMPVGIVTDRDIVIEIVAEGLSVDDFTAGDIMSAQLVSVQEQEDVVETIRRMRVHGIRRIPVVSQDGGLVGIMSVDDMLELLAEELSELAKVASREQAWEAETRVG